jgi:hypothetical protein
MQFLLHLPCLFGVIFTAVKQVAFADGAIAGYLLKLEAKHKIERNSHE